MGPSGFAAVRIQFGYDGMVILLYRIRLLAPFLPFSPSTRKEVPEWNELGTRLPYGVIRRIFFVF